jgi:hypothetical protein
MIARKTKNQIPGREREREGERARERVETESSENGIFRYL